VSGKGFSRALRIEELLHRRIAEIILRHQERAAFVGVTITSTKVSPDLSHAKIFVTLLDETKIEKSIQNLNLEVKFLRHILAKDLNLRFVPHLLFVYDSSIRYGERLDALINAAILSDAAKSH